MTRRGAIALSGLFTALWSVPLARAIWFYQECRTYHGDAGSVDAANDLTFSLALLASYTLSLLAALVVGWLCPRSRGWLFAIPLAMLVGAVAEVLLTRPEEVIVFFPTLWPWRPAVISLFALGIAVASARWSGSDAWKKR